MHNRSLNSHEPIHGSVFLLAFKLFVILFLSDAVYLLIDRSLFEGLQMDTYHNLVLLLTGLYIFKSLVQITLVLWVVFHWLYHKYHIDYAQKKLYEYKGILHSKEHMSDLKNVRDVSMEQTIFGKIFNYGNIVLTISASGGYAEKVRMKTIQEPKLYVDFLEACGN